MQILQSSEAIDYMGWFLPPFSRFVFHNATANNLASKLKPAGIPFQVSSFNSFERRYCAQDLNGKRVCLMRSNAYGDTLIATSIGAFLKHRFPEARIDCYTFPNVADLWTGTGVRPYALPLAFDAAISYHHHILLEGMFENNSEPEQGNCYDDQFAWMGFDPADVPPEFKRPTVLPLATDIEELMALGVRLSQPYIVYQMSAGNPNRTYPYAKGAALVRLLLSAYPKANIVLVGTDKTPGIREFNDLGDRVINLVNVTKKFRSIIPVVAGAALVICPDSSIGHLAGAFPDVPVVSLWGLFDPNDRAKYYANHHPIFFGQTACPHAPCRNHEFKLPQELCKDAVNATPGEQMHCNTLRAIDPEQILKLSLQLVTP